MPVKKRPQVKRGNCKKSRIDRFIHGTKAASSAEKTATNQNRENPQKNNRVSAARASTAPAAFSACKPIRNTARHTMNSMSVRPENKSPCGSLFLQKSGKNRAAGRSPPQKSRPAAKTSIGKTVKTKTLKTAAAASSLGTLSPAAVRAAAAAAKTALKTTPVFTVFFSA